MERIAPMVCFSFVCFWLVLLFSLADLSFLLLFFLFTLMDSGITIQHKREQLNKSALV